MHPRESKEGFLLATILFFDDWLLARRVDVVRKLGKPRYVPEATLEDDLSGGTWNRPTIFRVPEEGIWRALYTGVTYAGDTRVSLGIMVADSPDGIHWTKPDVTSRVHLPERIRANQVYTAKRFSGTPAFYDAREPDPSRRVKFFCAKSDYSEDEGLVYLTSPDGLAWNKGGSWGKYRLLDAPISVFYNEKRGTYVVSHRPINADRRVAFMETTDFKTFTQSDVVLHPDPEDPPLTEFYGMTVFPYESLYVGLLLVTHADPAQVNERASWVEGGLAYSQNGWNFHRAFHAPFIPRNDRSEQGGGAIYPSSMIIDDDHTIRIYSGASRAGHFQMKEPADAALVMHTLRLDGFTYLEPAGLVGRVTTRPLRFHGNRLQLNVRAPVGRVRTRFVDRSGVEIPGFGFAENIPFTGDALFHTPSWKDGKGVPDLAGREALLEIELTNAEMYAIRGDFNVTVGSGSWPDMLA